MTQGEAARALAAATVAMFETGTPLMRRLIPADEAVRLWDHYPPNDVICAASGSRYFYHLHPPEERGAREHGHFHLFLPRRAMADPDAPLCAPPGRGASADDAVHIAGLSVDAFGLPFALFSVNRWVTDEWLFPAQSILAALDGFDLTAAPGDPLVNAWLTAAVQLSRPTLGEVLLARDRRLHAADLVGENRDLEVLSSAPLDLQRLLDATVD